MRVDAVPMTRAPRARAICTANCPTPPAAACTSTVCPSRTPARSIDWYAVSPASGTAAASSNVSEAGLRAMVRTGAATSSANVPPCSQSLRTYP